MLPYTVCHEFQILRSGIVGSLSWSAENAENEDPNVAEERLKEEEAIQAIVDKHQPACDFVNAVEKMVPQLEELLSHNVESDVSGAVGMILLP